MRGTVPGLAMPYPLGPFLPGIYQEDDFTMRWMAAFDEVVAPAVVSLECVESYLDPRLAPRDFLDWLAGWVGAVTDENWDDERQRIAVLRAVELHRLRGLGEGLRDLLELASGGRVEVVDTGGVSWSTTPGAQLPDHSGQPILVRVAVPDPDGVSAALLDDLIRTAVPAHVRYRLEVVTDDRLH